MPSEIGSWRKRENTGRLVGSTLRDDRRGPVFLAVEVPDGVVTPEVESRGPWTGSFGANLRGATSPFLHVGAETFVVKSWWTLFGLLGVRALVGAERSPELRARGSHAPTLPCRSLSIVASTARIQQNHSRYFGNGIERSWTLCIDVFG